MRRRLLALLCVTGSLVSGCGLLPGGQDRHTVTVWLMKDSASKEFLQRFTDDFERTHEDLRLDKGVTDFAHAFYDRPGGVDHNAIVEICGKAFF